MRARFVRDDTVHYGDRVYGVLGASVVYFLCERHCLLPGSDRPPTYETGAEVFHVSADVDCMTCLVLEARIGGSA